MDGVLSEYLNGANGVTNTGVTTSIDKPGKTLQDKPFLFTGNATEYFNIWIVNILLTILTLGIYSAWAKVRNKRYFYGNTLVAGAHFDYTAQPMGILKGRLIAVAALVFYNILSAFDIAFGVILGLLFVFIIPWMIARSLAFNARNSVYRNVRFDFRASYAESLKVFVGWPLLVLLSLGILYPVFMFKMRQYLVENHFYGTSQCKVGFKLEAFFKMGMVVFGVFVVTAVVAVQFGASEPLLGLIYLALMLWVKAFTDACTHNIVFNGTGLDEQRFRSEQKTSELMMLYFTNWLAITFSLGLMIPWARVRSAKYRAARLLLLTDGSLDHFVAAELANVSAIGQEMGDVFDVEVAL